MSFLKILGALLVACSGIFLARSLNSAQRSMLRQLNGVIALLRFMETNIDAYSMPLPEILKRCPREIYADCGYSEDKPPSAVKDIFDVCMLLDGELRRQLDEFSCEVGRGYRQEQLALLKRTLLALEERRRLLSSALPGKTRVNAAVCISVSLSVVILFL